MQIKVIVSPRHRKSHTRPDPVAFSPCTSTFHVPHHWFAYDRSSILMVAWRIAMRSAHRANYDVPRHCYQIIRPSFLRIPWRFLALMIPPERNLRVDTCANTLPAMSDNVVEIAAASSVSWSLTIKLRVGNYSYFFPRKSLLWNCIKYILWISSSAYRISDEYLNII